MKLPRLLVVDDQFARDSTEWLLFKHHTGVIGTDEQGQKLECEALAEVVLCSGQREENGNVLNDYDVVLDAILADSGGAGSWSLIFLDVHFESGVIRGKLPVGKEGDSQFGEEVWRRLKLDFPAVPIVMMTSKNHRELTDSATPYLSKRGLDRHSVSSALLRFGRIDKQQIRFLLGLRGDEIAWSPVSLAPFRDVFLHIAGGAPILILGESGTGKEVLARYAHRVSKRKGPFVPVNVSALPEGLVESELFGVEKGVATGVSGRPGKFEMAAGGTLLLDEVADMSPEIQAKLLRALQERCIWRVGGTKEIPVEFQLLCATSRDLSALVSEGRFRADLWYRINTVSIEVPPLRARLEDIRPLAKFMLDKHASGKAGLSFSESALDALSRMAFNGNIRELESLIRRLVGLAGSHEVIGTDALDSGFLGSPTSSVAAQSQKSAVLHGPDPVDVQDSTVVADLSELLGLIEHFSVAEIDPALKGGKFRLELALHRMQKRMAAAALQRCRDPVSGSFNRQRAMQFLTGDPELKGKGPARVLNEILGRKQESKLMESDLIKLVEDWSNGQL